MNSPGEIEQQRFGGKIEGRRSGLEPTASRQSGAGFKAEIEGMCEVSQRWKIQGFGHGRLATCDRPILHWLLFER